MAKTKKEKSVPKATEKSEPAESKLEYDERAIELVLDCKQESMDFYEQKFKMFNYYDRLYHKGAAKTNVPYGRANLELPLAFQQIEPFVSAMSESTIAEAPILAFEGRNADDDATAEEITEFTQYQLEVGGFVPSYIQYLRNLGKYGTAVMKVIWETDVVEIENEVEKPIMIPQMDPMTGQVVMVEGGMETVIEKEDFKRHDGPRYLNQSLYDFFVPRSASGPDVQKMEWVIGRSYRGDEDILNNPNYTRNAKRVKQLLEDAVRDETDARNGIKDVEKRRAEEQKNPSQGSKKYDGQIEVLEYWGRWKVKKDDMQSIDALIVIASINDEWVLLRCDPNPLKFKFKPYIMSNDYSIEGEPYGYGELHHIKGLIEESTALRNARLDVANISLNRVWLVERQAGVNLRELYTAPNKIILTNDMNGVRPMDMGQVTPSSVNELARIDFDIQNTTEIINPRQDVSNVGAAFGGTATGVNFLAAKTNLRLLTKARIQQETFFKPLAQMSNWYNRDLITDETYYRVKGEDSKNPYRSISPDAFLTPVDFKPISNPQKQSTAEKKENMGYLLQTIAQVEGVAPGINNWPELMKEVYKLSGFSHPDRYILPQQTVCVQTPDGQVLDRRGQPVQIVPVDEAGQPLPQEGQMPIG